jgi:twitching motility protein PilT
VQLSTVLEAVVSQQLFPAKDGRGMVPAVEVMLGTAAIRNMIREEKTHQIPSMIETGTRFGMRSMQASMEELIRNDLIDATVTLDSNSYL